MSPKAPPGIQASPQQLRRFRLEGLGLAERPQASPEALEAAAGVGVQDSVRHTAAVALNARLEGLTPAMLQEALASRRLLRLWSLRISPFVVPASAWPAFTLGACPQNEAERLPFLLGMHPHLEALGLGLDALLAAIREATLAALDGRALNKQSLGVAVAEAVGQSLGPSARRHWESEAPHPVEATMGVQFVRLLLRVVSLEGHFCDAMGRGATGGEADFVRVDQWLGAEAPKATPDEASRDLLRRFLRMHGPANAAQCRAWTGVGKAQGDRMWGLVERELVPVAWGKGQHFLHEADLPAFQAAADAEPAKGLRWLPAYDPLLASPDRAFWMPDVAFQKELWRGAGNPGALLVDGHVVGAWKAKKAGKKLQLSLASPQPLPSAWRARLEAEAAGLAPFREVASVQLLWGTESV